MSTQELYRALAFEDLGSTLRNDVAAALKKNDEDFSALEQSFSMASSRLLAEMPQLVAHQREMMTAAAAPVAAGDQHPMDATRFLTLDEHLNDIESLRDRLFEESGLDAHRDLALRSLIKGGAELLPRLSRKISQSTVLGARLLSVNDPHRSDTLQRMTSALVESEMLLGSLRISLKRGVALGWLSKQWVDPSVASMEKQVKWAQRLAVLARSQASAEELVIALGKDAPAFVEAMDSAGQSAVLLESAAIQALATGLEVQKRYAAWKALLGLAMPTLFFLLLYYFMFSAFKVLKGGLDAVTRNVEELAKGNLGIRPRPLGKDESSRTLESLAVSAERMSRLFEAVTRGVGTVSQASREVAAGNGGLSERTTEIREAITNVARKALAFSSMMDECGAELAQTVEHVRAMQVEAARSRKAMSGLRERMRVLTSKSCEISHVVQIMEGVAFQTKLLALNASVEAARAGSAGKGFAVVAQEVRSLAVRSEESARRIHNILSSSISEIEECNMMSERASDAVRNTDDKIQSVHQSMGDIVRHTQVGMNESQEVVRITRQVEESIGGNARLVEQLSDASLALREQGDSLRRSVYHFLAR